MNTFHDFHHHHLSFSQRLVWRGRIAKFGLPETSNAEQRDVESKPDPNTVESEPAPTTREDLDELKKSVSPVMDFINKIDSTPDLPQKEKEIRKEVLEKLVQLYNQKDHINYGLMIEGRWVSNAGLKKHIDLILSVWEEYDRYEKAEGHKEWEKKVYYRYADMYDNNALGYVGTGEKIKQSVQRGKDQRELRRLERTLRKKAKEDGISTEFSEQVLETYRAREYPDYNNEKAGEAYKAGSKEAATDHYEYDRENKSILLSKENIKTDKDALDQFEKAINALPSDKNQVDPRLLEDMGKELKTMAEVYAMNIQAGNTYESPELEGALKANIARSKELLSKLESYKKPETLYDEAKPPEKFPEEFREMVSAVRKIEAFVEDLGLQELKTAKEVALSFFEQIKSYEGESAQNPEMLIQLLDRLGIDMGSASPMEQAAAVILFNKKAAGEEMSLEQALESAKNPGAGKGFVKEVARFSSMLVKASNEGIVEEWKEYELGIQEDNRAREAERADLKKRSNFEDLYDPDPEKGAEAVEQYMTFMNDFSRENLTADDLRGSFAVYVERLAKYHLRTKAEYTGPRGPGEKSTSFFGPTDESSESIGVLFAKPYDVELGSLSPAQEKQMIKSLQQFLVNETGVKNNIDGKIGPETITLMNAYVKTLVGPGSPEATTLLDPRIRFQKDGQKTKVKEMEANLKRKGYVEARYLEQANALNTLYQNAENQEAQAHYAERMSYFGYTPGPNGAEKKSSIE